jgi:hypothetical protein
MLQSHYTTHPNVPNLLPPLYISLLFLPALCLCLFSTTHCSLKAYCAIWVRSSNFRHQASPHVSPRESTQRRLVEPWARNVRKFCLNADFHVTFSDLSHVVKLRHGTDDFTSPYEGRRAEDFFALKIPRFRAGANPRTWVPKTSTLPLDHRSRITNFIKKRLSLLFIIELVKLLSIVNLFFFI